MRLSLVTREYFLIVTLVLLPLSTLADSVPSAVAFTSPAQTIAVGVVSEVLSVQVQDGSGEQIKVPSTACALVTSSSSTGEFSSSASNWNLVSVLTISKNSANRNFYYKDTEEGTPTLSVNVVIRPDTEARACASWPTNEWPEGWTASQVITVGNPGTSSNEEDDGSSEVTQVTEVVATPPPATPPSSGIVATIEPRIFTAMRIPTGTVAGADAVFTASTVGLKKEPITNARYIWSFGDGAIEEGNPVYHTYHYPGSYVVVVSVASGEWGATDRKDVVVTAPMLAVTNIKEGPDGFIEIKNAGKTDIDLSRWFLGVNGTFFMFPSETILRAGKAVPFPSAITKLLATADAVLLYPNGKVVAGYQPNIHEVSVTPATRSIPETIPKAVSKAVRPQTVLDGTIEMPLEEEIIPIKESSNLVESLGAGVASSDTERGLSLWFLSAVALSLVTAGGYILVSQTPAVAQTDTKSLSADDFDIEEDNT